MSSRLNVDPKLLRLLDIPLGMLVRDRDRQPLHQLLGGVVNWGGMGKFGEDHQLHVEERQIPAHGVIDHLQHPVDARFYVVARARVGQIDLAGGGVVAIGHGAPSEW